MKYEATVRATLDPAKLGTIVAEADAEEQAAFFNALAGRFQAFAEGDKDGMQMLWIKEGLDDKTRAFFRKLVEYACGPESDRVPDTYHERMEEEMIREAQDGK